MGPGAPLGRSLMLGHGGAGAVRGRLRGARVWAVQAVRPLMCARGLARVGVGGGEVVSSRRGLLSFPLFSSLFYFFCISNSP